MNPVLHALNVLAGTIHGGALITFALLLAFRSRIPHVSTVDVVRVYRAFGAGIGLSLGVFVPTDLYRHVHALNPTASLPYSLALHFDAAEHCLLSTRMIVLFALWVSYVHLEVWTIEPARRLDKEGVVADLPAYEAAASKISRQLSLNAALFAAVLVLGALPGTWP